MTRVRAVLIAGVGIVAAVLSAQTPAPPPGSGLKLVLLVAVDQFRADYLTRSKGDYSSGLKKLMTDGAYFTDASLDHYPTVTAPGHATMLSGAYLSQSGIIGNDWFDRDAGRSVNSISDDRVKTVGGATGGEASPRRLQVSTVGDEMKKASKAKKGTPEAPRVIGLSFKDRSAILPVGRDADAAFWVDDTKSGNFVTSSYYMAKPPDWLTAFNAKRLSDSFAGQKWTALGSPDIVFNLLSGAPGTAELYAQMYQSPFGNDLLLALAEEVLAREQLGQRNVTDLFSISFSSNDSVGHGWGPDSPRVKDISIKTDGVIGKLLDAVDRAVGLSNTLVIFTADHGVAPVPEEQEARGQPGGRILHDDLFGTNGAIEKALSKRFGDLRPGEGRWILGTAGSSPYFNYPLLTLRDADPSQARRAAAEAAAAVPHVAKVFTRDQLQQKRVPDDRVSRRVLHGFHSQRSGDLEILLEPYWLRLMPNQAPTGSTHGTPYGYDAKIPLILMGSMIKAGEYDQPVILNDLAPTVSAILGIKPPSASTGKVLKDALK